MIDYARRNKILINIAEQDLPVAQSLFDIGHLILEKILKADYVKDNKKTPPKTHNLVHLAKNINLEWSDEQLEYFDIVNDFNIEARYIDYKNSFYQKYTPTYTEESFNNIKEQYKWIKEKIKS
ncbi:MAG: HEPN domain-containing protein [Bacteroidota bacterium]|nr:HEPN domain-containing protein [Bacteroidota bacterium]